MHLAKRLPAYLECFARGKGKVDSVERLLSPRCPRKKTGSAPPGEEPVEDCESRGTCYSSSSSFFFP
jgi:hypothetical protein